MGITCKVFKTWSYLIFSFRRNQALINYLASSTLSSSHYCWPFWRDIFYLKHDSECFFFFFTERACLQELCCIELKSTGWWFWTGHYNDLSGILELHFHFRQEFPVYWIMFCSCWTSMPWSRCLLHNILMQNHMKTIWLEWECMRSRVGGQSHFNSSSCRK